MTEIRSVTAAERYRVIQDAARQRNQQQADAERTQTQNFEQAQRNKQLVQLDARLAERRIQDRRDLITVGQEAKRAVIDQQRAQDFTANDVAIAQRRDIINEQLDSTLRASDIVQSDQLSRDASARIAAAEQRSLQQRQEDLRLALIEREERIVQRRVEDRNAEIQQEAQLKRSVDRIQNDARNSHSGAERPRGAVLDVSG